jgi:hypothetical protein
MKRVLLVLTVALVIAAMVVAMAMPAFAQGRPSTAKPPESACERIFDSPAPVSAQERSGCLRS